MKFENILLGMLSALLMWIIMPIVLVVCALYNIYLSICCGSLAMIWYGIKDDMAFCLAVVRMVGHIFKTGDAKEATIKFFEEIETL